jgi:hypothetical protein
MISHNEVCKRFADYYPRDSKGVRVFSSGNFLYSYGTHFILAVRAEKGRDFGRGIKFIINGDKYSISTSQHQTRVIQECKPNIQIPFSALFEADVYWPDRWNPTQPKFKIVDFIQDTWENYCRVCGKPVKGGWKDNGYHYSHNDDSPLCLYEEVGVSLVEEARRPLSRHTLGGVLLKKDKNYYLSSMDFEERIPNYFLSHLPHKVKTVPEAFESLKPQIIRDKEHEGVLIKRQGDIFVYRTDLTLKEVRKQVGIEVKPYKWHQLFDSNHFATEGMEFKGCHLVRGCLYHNPERRRPDHRRITINDGWYLAVKNTAIKSWSARGRVD